MRGEERDILTTSLYSPSPIKMVAGGPKRGLNRSDKSRHCSSRSYLSIKYIKSAYNDNTASWTLLKCALLSLGETNIVSDGHPAKGSRLPGFWSWHAKNLDDSEETECMYNTIYNMAARDLILD